MKYELTPEDKKKIEQVHKYDPVAKFLKNQENCKFKVGDILVKMVPSYSEANGSGWKPERVSHVTDVPKKFLYAFEDECGIGFVKTISSSGKPSAGLTPMTEYDYNYVRFELDPELADHVLLADEGEEYDATSAYKAKKRFREKAYRNNKKQMVPIETMVDRAKFIETLKVGDKFWIGHDMDQMVKRQVEVLEISVGGGTSYDRQWEERNWQRSQVDEPGLAAYTLKSVKVKILSCDYAQSVGTTESFTTRGIQRFITLKPPFPLSET